MELTEKQKQTLKRNNAESNYVTREAIREALYILMRKKSFEEIKITDIIARSGVSRSAFYRNYKTKEEILHDTVAELHAVINEGATNSLHNNWSATFRLLRQNQDKLNLIIQAGLEHHLLAQMNQSLDLKSGADYVVAMNNGLIYNVLLYWVKCGMPGTDQEAAEQIVNAYEQMIIDLKQYS